MITGAREGDEISLMNIQKFVRVVAIRDAYIYIYTYIYSLPADTYREKDTGWREEIKGRGREGG